jgi:hypothetical protein
MLSPRVRCTEPRVGSSTPARLRSRVVFPNAPFGADNGDARPAGDGESEVLEDIHRAEGFAEVLSGEH